MPADAKVEFALGAPITKDHEAWLAASGPVTNL